EKLGTRGQVVEVADGYARNYLLPRKLAIEASAGNVKRLEKIRTVLAKRTANEKGGAEKLAELLAAVSVKLKRKSGENDQLFGSEFAAVLLKISTSERFPHFPQLSSICTSSPVDAATWRAHNSGSRSPPHAWEE